MSRAEVIQLLGIVQLVVAFSWMFGPWFLLAIGAVFVLLPEVMAKEVRKR